MLHLLLTLAFAVPPIAPDILRGFDHGNNIEYDEALAIFERAAVKDPSNPHCQNYIAQTILYRAMFKAGALESELVSGTNPFLRRERMNPTEAEHQGFDNAIDSAFKLAQARIAKEPKDAYALYSIAITYGLRANYSFLVRKAWLDALKDSTASRKHAQLAIDADPTYIDAKIILGLHDYIVGSLSWTYKMLGFLAGIRGDREGGIRTLEEVAAKGVNNRSDAKILLAAIYRREKRPAQAVPLLESLITAYPRNYLFRIELAHMYADQGERDKALVQLGTVSGIQPEKLAYLKGNLLFWFDEYDKAILDLQRAVAAREHLDLNTAIMACLRLGQTFDLLNRRQEAIAAYKLGAGLAPGSELAKECLNYIERKYKRSRIA